MAALWSQNGGILANSVGVLVCDTCPCDLECCQAINPDVSYGAKDPGPGTAIIFVFDVYDPVLDIFECGEGERYEVQESFDGGAWTTVKAASDQGNHYQRDNPAEGSYCYRARARSNACNWSDWTAEVCIDVGECGGGTSAWRWRAAQQCWELTDSCTGGAACPPGEQCEQPPDYDGTFNLQTATTPCVNCETAPPACP